jgi:hypothetical protein
VEDVAEVDASAWPLVVMRVPPHVNAAAIDSMLIGYDAVLGRKAKFAMVVDTTSIAKIPDAIERRRIVEYMRARTFAEAAYNLGNGVVIVSTPARAVLTAINWIRPAVVPQRLFGTFGEAVEWCSDRLGKAGLSVPREAKTSAR